MNPILATTSSLYVFVHPETKATGGELVEQNNIAHTHENSSNLMAFRGERMFECKGFQSLYTDQ
jgi:hypothetical protein